MFQIHIEERDCNGDCQDYYPATEGSMDVVFSNLQQAINYVLSQCKTFPPFIGKYTYHILQEGSDKETLTEVEVNWQAEKQKYWALLNA